MKNLSEKLNTIADTLLIEASGIPLYEEKRYIFLAIAATVEALRDKVECSS